MNLAYFSLCFAIVLYRCVDFVARSILKVSSMSQSSVKKSAEFRSTVVSIYSDIGRSRTSFLPYRAVFLLRACEGVASHSQSRAFDRSVSHCMILSLPPSLVTGERKGTKFSRHARTIVAPRVTTGLREKEEEKRQQHHHNHPRHSFTVHLRSSVHC